MKDKTLADQISKAQAIFKGWPTQKKATMKLQGTDPFREWQNLNPQAENEATCNVPPAGWSCSRVKGHEGPCAASAIHSDDAAVDRFAERMKAKLALSREKGRGGWETASDAYLSKLLREHVEKGDPVDVANLAMMLSENRQSIVKDTSTIIDNTTQDDKEFLKICQDEVFRSSLTSHPRKFAFMREMEMTEIDQVHDWMRKTRKNFEEAVQKRS